MQPFGIDRQLQEIEDFVLNYKYQTKKILLLVGKPGTGKTSSVYHIANKHSFEVIEFNVSEQRRKDFVTDIISAILCSSLTRSIVLLDEIDGLTTNSQRRIAKISKSSNKPIIATANEIKKIIPTLRNSSLIIWFNFPTLAQKLQFKAKQKLDIPAEKLNKLTDYRQLKMASNFYTDGYNSELSVEERIANMLTKGDYSELKRDQSLYKDDLTILLDQSPNFVGVELIQFVCGLIAYDIYVSPEILNGFKYRVTKDKIVKRFQNIAQEIQR